MLVLQLLVLLVVVLLLQLLELLVLLRRYHRLRMHGVRMALRVMLDHRLVLALLEGSDRKRRDDGYSSVTVRCRSVRRDER